MATWNFIVAGIVGLALGSRYRIGALIGATLLFAAAMAAAFSMGRLGIGEGVLVLVTLQLSYFAGLVLSSLWRRRSGLD